MKKQLFIIILIGILGFTASANAGFFTDFFNQLFPQNIGATILYPQGGGTGKGSATAGDIGKYLKVSNNSPFTYSFDTPAGGGTINQLGQIGDVSTTTLAWGSVIRYNTSTTKWESVATSTLGISGSGTVTSVAMSVPTGLTISGSPITTAGTLALTYTAGYTGVLTASTTNWNTFYDTPSNRITAGTNLSWSANTLNASITGGTGTVSTSTNEISGRLSYWTSNSATPALLGQVATTTPTISTGLTYSGTMGSLVGGVSGNLTVNTSQNINTLSNLTSNGLIYTVGGGGTLNIISTSTLTASAPLTGSFTQIGSGGSLGCTTASSGVNGCLSGTDWNTFNNKQATISATWPITLTGATVGFNGLSTSTAAVLGNIPYFSGVNTFANVATTTLTGTAPIVFSNAISVIGGSASAISCTAASASVAGCLSSANWTTFNNKVDTTVATLSSLASIGTITTGVWNAGALTSSGAITGTNLVINSTTATSTFSTGGLTVGTSQFVVQQTSGNVGIGTTGPDTILYVKGANPHITFENTTDHTGKSYFGTYNDNIRTLIQLSVNRKTSDGTVPDSGRAPAYLDIISSPGDGHFAFSTTATNGGSPVIAMIIRGSGNVGIGTTTPSMKFSVQGDALADSWNVYSNIFTGDALTALKGIKAKTGQLGNWAKVDHKTLPVGVLKEIPTSYRKEFYEAQKAIGGTMGTESTITGYKEIVTGKIISVKTYNALPESSKYQNVPWTLEAMDISALTQMNTQAILQLESRIRAIEVKLGI